MKKVLASVTKYIFAAFVVAILGLLMSLTYQALGRIFPGNFVNQMWGLVLFDLAAMIWALTFVFHSQSTGQYAASAIGFLTGFLGTLLMVAAEVMLSSTDLTQQTNTAQIGQWLVYGFIIATILHAALVYSHHASAPDISEKINVGVARGEIVTEAIRQATNHLDAEKAQLAQTISQEISDQVKRDLNIPILADPRLPFLPHPMYNQDKDKTDWTYPYQPGREPILSNFPKPAEHKDPTTHPRHLQPKDRAGYPDNYGPMWESSTDITPTLDAYPWVCLHCNTNNAAYTRTCQECQKPRTNNSPVTAIVDTPAAKEAGPKPSPFQPE